MFNIPNYSSEHILRNNKRGGGVSIFINNNIKYKLIDNVSLSINYAYDVVTKSFIYEHINYLLSGKYLILLNLMILYIIHLIVI